MAWTKKFKKTTGKMSTAVKKRYGIGKGRGGFKFQKLAKDLAEVKSRLNVEKKFLDQDLYNGQTVGQSRDENPGEWHADLTPQISQGVGENNRIGNSIKATGMVVRMNFRQQANAGKRIAKICIVRSTDTGLNNPVGQIWDPNPLTGFIDFHSPRNYSSIRQGDDTHKLIATRYVSIKDTGGGEDAVASLKFALKLNDVIRYPTDGSTTPDGIRYHMYVFLDYGNADILQSTSNAGCMIGGVATGAMFNQQVRLWYVDN